MADKKDTDLHSKVDRLAETQERNDQKTHQNQLKQKTHGLSNLTMNFLQHGQNKKIDKTGKDLKQFHETLKEFYVKQKKHNRGARDARIQILNNQDNMMGFIRRGGRGGGPGGGPGGGGPGRAGPGGPGTVVVGPGVGRGGPGGGPGGGNQGGSNWQEGPGGWGPGSPLSGGMSGGGRTSSIVDQTGFVDASRLRKEPVAQTLNRTGFLGRAGEQVDVQGRIINERLVGDRRGAGAALRGLGGRSIGNRLSEMDNQYATTERGMRKLTLGGREMARAEVGRDGRTRYRDERTGEFARVEKFQQSERRRNIFEGALEGTRANTQFQRRATGVGIQRQREVMGAALQQNAGAIQAIVEDNPAMAAEMAELQKLQEKAQGLRGNEGREARQKVSEQLGRIQSTDSTGQMGNLLNVQGQRSALESGSGLKDMFNIDQDAGLLTGAKQFFGLDRMFGDAGTGGITNLYSQSRKDRLADEAGALGVSMDTQQSNLEDVTGKDMLRLTGKDIFEHDARKGENLEPVAPTLGEQVAQESQQGAAQAPARGRARPGNAGGIFQSGTDSEGVQQRQLEELVKIREILEEGGGAGGGDGGGGGGFFGGRGRRGSRGGRGGRGGRMSRMLAGRGGMLMKAGGAALAVGAGAYTAYKGVSQANEQIDAGEITQEEAQTDRAEAVGEGVGGAAGAIGGAKLGMMIGAFGGPIGVAVGGIIGGAVGWMAGSWLGEKTGGSIADAIDVSPGKLAESAAQTEEALKQISARDSGLASKIKQESDEIYNSLVEEAGGDEKLDDRDKAALRNAANVKAMSNNSAAITAIGIDRKKIAETLREKTDAGMESAQASGLYDHDRLGDSELDRSKLGDASNDELQAIIQHDDLDEEDMAAVKKEMEIRKSSEGSIDRLREANGLGPEGTDPATTQGTASSGSLLADHMDDPAYETIAEKIIRENELNPAWEDKINSMITRTVDGTRVKERFDGGVSKAFDTVFTPEENAAYRELTGGSMGGHFTPEAKAFRQKLKDAYNVSDQGGGMDAADPDDPDALDVTDVTADIEQAAADPEDKLKAVEKASMVEKGVGGSGPGLKIGTEKEGDAKGGWLKSMKELGKDPWEKPWARVGAAALGPVGMLGTAALNVKDMVMGKSGAALDYMGADGMGDIAAAQPVVNNITNNNAGPPPENLLITPGTVRSSDSTIQRYQDARYTG